MSILDFLYKQQHDHNKRHARVPVQGSDPSPYKVRFFKIGDKLSATCSCRAGKMGQLCKHRLSILKADKITVVSDNLDQVNEVASWIQSSNVSEALAEVAKLKEEKKNIEERLKRAKRLVEKALIY